MIAAGPAARRYEPSSEGVMNLIRQLATRRDLDYFRLDGRGLKLELRRHGAEPLAAP
jgi:hypothetical protein